MGEGAKIKIKRGSVKVVRRYTKHKKGEIILSVFNDDNRYSKFKDQLEYHEPEIWIGLGNSLPLASGGGIKFPDSTRTTDDIQRAVEDLEGDGCLSTTDNLWKIYQLLTQNGTYDHDLEYLYNELIGPTCDPNFDTLGKIANAINNTVDYYNHTHDLSTFNPTITNFPIVRGGHNSIDPTSARLNMNCNASYSPETHFHTTNHWTFGSLVTYYVRITGNDTTGDGTIGNPWFSIHKAYDYLNHWRAKLNHVIWINIGSGTYNYTSLGPCNLSHNSGQIIIQGAGKLNTILYFGSSNGLHCERGNYADLRDLTVQCSGRASGHIALSVRYNANVQVYNCRFTSAMIGVNVDTCSNIIINSSDSTNYSSIWYCETAINVNLKSHIFITSHTSLGINLRHYTSYEGSYIYTQAIYNYMYTGLTAQAAIAQCGSSINILSGNLYSSSSNPGASGRSAVLYASISSTIKAVGVNVYGHNPNSVYWGTTAYAEYRSFIDCGGAVHEVGGVSVYGMYVREMSTIKGEFAQFNFEKYPTGDSVGRGAYVENKSHIEMYGTTVSAPWNPGSYPWQYGAYARTGGHIAAISANFDMNTIDVFDTTPPHVADDPIGNMNTGGSWICM